MQRAYFSAGLGKFLGMRDEEVLGQMAQRTEYAVDLTQRDAWVEQRREKTRALKHPMMQELLTGKTRLV
jgi:hypothetical protein